MSTMTNEEYFAEQERRADHLKAILCGLYMRYCGEMPAYDAAVKTFEAFRKRMTSGKPIQKAAWLHTLFNEKQILIPYNDMQKINAEFWKWDEAVYNKAWLMGHRSEWCDLCGHVNRYYESLTAGYFELKELDYLAFHGIYPSELVDFLDRQQMLAEISLEHFSMRAAFRLLLAGYTYGIRAERARRRGSKTPVPVVRRPHYSHDGHRMREAKEATV